MITDLDAAIDEGEEVVWVCHDEGHFGLFSEMVLRAPVISPVILRQELKMNGEAWRRTGKRKGSRRR